MVKLSAERMASPPAPGIAERMEKKKPKTSTKENRDTDFEGKKSQTSVKKSQEDEDERKEPAAMTEDESQRDDSNQTVKDSQEKESKPSALDSTDKDEKEENVTRKVNDSATSNDDGENKVEEEKAVESKLDAAALSASLSSSRCLLKRNRDDLELDSDGDYQEEPDCKKSHTASAPADDKTGEKQDKEEDDGTEENDTEAPVVVVVEKSMLPPAELVASLSSSKSVLKRSIDQVTESTEGSAAPEVKKSNIVSDEGDTESSEDVSSPVEPSDDLETPVKPSRTISNVSAINIPSPRMLIMSPSSPSCASKCPPPVLESTRLSPLRDGDSNKEEREALKKSPKNIPKEEVRVIAAKDLAEDRKLEKRRLNKLLTIFDDQKPVK